MASQSDDSYPMKHLFIVVLSLTWSQPALAQSNESEAIKRVIEQETDNYAAGNFDAWSSFWVHEPYILWIVNQPDGGYHSIQGWDELSAQMKGLIADNAKKPSSSSNRQRTNYGVRQNGTMAFATFDQASTSSPVRTRESRVLEKKGNEWKLIHSSVLIAWPEVVAASKGTSTTKSTAFQKGTYIDAPSKMTLTFGDEGKFISVMNGTMGVEGSYKVVDNTIEITDTSGPRACKGQMGKYKWTLADKSLTFLKIDDLCVGRIRGLTQKTFTQE